MLADVKADITISKYFNLYIYVLGTNITNAITSRNVKKKKKNIYNMSLTYILLNSVISGMLVSVSQLSMT